MRSIAHTVTSSRFLHPRSTPPPLFKRSAPSRRKRAPRGIPGRSVLCALDAHRTCRTDYAPTRSTRSSNQWQIKRETLRSVASPKSAVECYRQRHFPGPARPRSTSYRRGRRLSRGFQQQSLCWCRWCASRTCRSVSIP